ncbi:MAG: hypothetical protein V8R48_02445 [Eggerthella lenta]
MEPRSVVYPWKLRSFQSMPPTQYTSGFTFTACSMAAPIVRRPSPDGEGLSSLG